MGTIIQQNKWGSLTSYFIESTVTPGAEGPCPYPPVGGREGATSTVSTALGSGEVRAGGAR